MSGGIFSIAQTPSTSRTVVESCGHQLSENCEQICKIYKDSSQQLLPKLNILVFVQYSNCNKDFSWTDLEF